MGKRVNARRDQCGRGDESVHLRVLPGIDKGIGMYLNTHPFYIPPEQDLDHYRYGDNDQGNRVVCRRLGMDDLFYGLRK